MEYLGMIIITIVILIAIFLLLREVSCWYFKINQNLKIQEELLKLQRETVQLLEKLVKTNKGSSSDNDMVNTKDTLDNKPNPDKLSDEEIENVNLKIPDLKENEVIVIHSVSRIIKRIHKTEFAKDKGWIIVKEFAK